MFNLMSCSYCWMLPPTCPTPVTPHAQSNMLYTFTRHVKVASRVNGGGAVGAVSGQPSKKWLITLNRFLTVFENEHVIIINYHLRISCVGICSWLLLSLISKNLVHYSLSLKCLLIL